MQEDQTPDIGQEFRKSKDQFTTSEMFRSRDLISPAYENEEIGEQVTGFQIFKELLTDSEIKEVFQTIDTSGDGYITKDEISFFLDFLGLEATAQDIEEMIDLCDPEKPHKVDFNGFESMIKSVYPLAHNNMPTPDTKIKKRAVALARQNHRLSQLILSDSQESRNTLITALTATHPQAEAHVETYPKGPSHQKREKSIEIRVNNFISLSEKGARPQAQLKAMKSACQQFYQEHMDLPLLKQLVQVSVARAYEFESIELLIDLVKKYAPIKQAILKSLLQMFSDSEDKVQLAEVFTSLTAVTGLNSYTKMLLILPLYPRDLCFSELNWIINRLMFSETSQLQTRLRTVFARKKLTNNVSREEILALFEEFGTGLIV